LAAVGVILSVCYLLWLYQRVFFGETPQEVRAHVLDLRPREWAAMLPLVVLMFWMGIYTRTFLPPVTLANREILQMTNVNVQFQVRAPLAPAGAGDPHEVFMLSRDRQGAVVLEAADVR